LKLSHKKIKKDAVPIGARDFVKDSHFGIK